MMLPLTSWEAAEGSRRREEQPEVSWSTLFGRAVKESYRYVVVGYSMAKGMGIGKFLASEIFLVGRYLWVIYFYPEGKNREDDDYVSVSPFELILVDQSGKGEHIVKSRFGGKRPDGPLRLWGYKHMGSNRFIKKAALERSAYLQEDSDYTTMERSADQHLTPGQWSIPVPPSDLGPSLDELLMTEMGSDIVFVVPCVQLEAYNRFYNCPEKKYVHGTSCGMKIYIGGETRRKQYSFRSGDIYLCRKHNFHLTLAEGHRCPGLKSACLKFIGRCLEASFRLLQKLHG
ncbi:unnamed protein product [Spirodela intermedia]|uniref:MATH domain-containing protein n=1 Tax=Spirodela intermedia TaxID=51605 RepID=A0A7I8JDR9_SPIIN|nr:unnamed protein product [Spirodela intermedia]CAA6667673.1 unnamed protein product [Spirodela intermedia]